ncbi:hypothetical protein DXG01_003993 [Tephrocybe rancida]|nr:hypothetical protein DXG01_003993 [Tephrocybe rancida]
MPVFAARHFEPMDDIQDMIDGASKSLRYLSITIGVSDEGFVRLSLAKLSTLTEMTFVVFPRALPALTIIGNVIESLPTSNALRRMFLVSECRSWDDDADLGEWERLDHLLTHHQHAETLQAFYFVVPNLQDQFGRAWVASMSTRLPAMTAVKKIVVVEKSDCMSLRFDELGFPDHSAHTISA